MVAVNPSRPCGLCLYCQKGQQNHCLDMLFYGSAMRMPHVQGAFQQDLVAQASQCHVVAPGVSLEEAAFAEPFAVTLHAIVRAGSLAGKRVLVTGCGPIGTLAIIAARFHGAREIVASDVSDYTLGLARHGRRRPHRERGGECRGAGRLQGRQGLVRRDDRMLRQ